MDTCILYIQASTAAPLIDKLLPKGLKGVSTIARSLLCKYHMLSILAATDDILVKELQ